ncbi:MAG: hypothetical protein M3R70_14350 [Actinomycetota bacterium]|nr:hypothetical protein [Actinomycetota bacterium]
MNEVARTALGTSGDVRLVQFPHPGGEHSMPASGRRPWKLGRENHARTFLLSPGTYRSDVQAEDQHGKVAFWGEWEGAVDLAAEVDWIPGGPRWLCRPDPHAAEPPSDDGSPPQNTDPFVWGDAIRYTFCRQPGNGKLRRLGRGSVILFGSSLDHRFVLDAVLVVAGWVEHRRRDDLAGYADETYMGATIDPMYGWGEDGHTYRLYVGATPDEPVDGMFSFVPCRRAAGARSGFARPPIELNGLINPNARMQARMLEVGPERIPELWRTVVEIVRAEGLALATNLQLERQP